MSKLFCLGMVWSLLPRTGTAADPTASKQVPAGTASGETRSAPARSGSTPGQAAGQAYVFAYFNTGKSGESQGLQLAYSHDGLDWKAIPAPDGTFLKPTVGGKLLRDPSIVAGPDGTFHMVWTTDWWRHGIGLAHSTDLIHWSTQNYLDVMHDFPGTLNCWAPEITYDADRQTYLIYWASTIPGAFPQTEASGDEIKAAKARANHRIYLTTTQDFKTYTPTRLLYDDGYNVIDAFITADPQRQRFVMVLKDETRFPVPHKNLRLAFASHPEGPWSPSTPPFSPDWVEGAAVLKVGDSWLLYFDAYTRHRYEGLSTTDFEHWTPITDQLMMPDGMRHGTPFPVPEAVLQKLLSAAPAQP
jgi:hypothetical protein